MIAPSTSVSISPAPQVRRGVADGGGSVRDPLAACWNSHATSVEDACRAYSALPLSARPIRSACSVQRPISLAEIASSCRPSASSLRL